MPAAADMQVPAGFSPQYSDSLDSTGIVGETALEPSVGDPSVLIQGAPAVPDDSAPMGRSGRASADTAWATGLASWRAGDYAGAAGSFETAATNGRSPWFIAGGAFWAARAHLFARQPDEVTRWLKVAAEAPHTFYGILARRILGLPMPFRWDLSEADRAAVAAVSDSADGQSALALIASGDYAKAERILRSLAGGGRGELAHGAMIVAENAGMADLAFRFSRLLASSGIDYPRASYPIPRWRPEGGFSTDRALVYALMRQESNFNPGAVSRAGARGVMQLMPATARFIARTTGYPGGAAQYRRPEVSIALGERYLELLLADDTVGPDLFMLTAAWNGGPANVDRWRRNPEVADDPLLFIETIPFGETRGFIEHVLANLWIYRHRLGIDSPSLDALAAGQWPNWDIPQQNTEIAEHE